MKISRVQQEDMCGCGIACAAMISGKTYREVRDFCAANGFDTSKLNQSGGGMCDFVLVELLLRLGYGAVFLFKFDQFTRNVRDNWPNVKIGDAQICGVTLKNGGHWVVLQDGVTYDPASPERTRIDDPLFIDVYQSLCVFALPEAIH